MLEQLQEEKIKKFKARGGLVIPSVNLTDRFKAKDTLTFFRRLWALNKREPVSTADFHFNGYDYKEYKDEFVVPSGPDKSAVVLRYSYQPPEADDLYGNAIERHTVLTEPVNKKVGSFTVRSELIYSPSACSGFAVSRDRISLRSRQNATSLYLVDKRDMFYSHYYNDDNPEKKALIIARQFISEFVEIVS